MENDNPQTDDLDEEFCPCGGPPCQVPAGYGCGLMTKAEWIAQWEKEKEEETAHGKRHA
jgi:hypothetical protein